MLVPVLMIIVHVLILAMSYLQGRDARENGYRVWFLAFVGLMVFNAVGIVAWGSKLFKFLV